MASPQQQTTMDDLPTDVLSNILIRLLARELVQMKCVSKSWNALLSQSSFVKSHLHHSIHNNDDAVPLVFTKWKNSFDHNSFTPHASRSPNLQRTNFIKIPIDSQSEEFTVIGSVNGLICLSHASYGSSYCVSIWNPSLSAMLNLPPFAMPAHGYNDSIKFFFRFGFDPKTDDYKVIKLAAAVEQHHFYPFGRPIDVVKDWLEIEVYSMRKGTWYLTNQSFPSHVSSLTVQDKVFGDGRAGHLHWLAYIRENTMKQTIVAFDLDVETFRDIPFPNSMRDYSVSNVLGVLAGKLCVMSRGVDGKLCEVWVMDEYGVAESWSKRHAFLRYDIIPYGFTLHNEFIFDGSLIGLVMYDPISDKLKGIHHVGIIRGNTKIIEYVDSLVWIVPAQCEISSHFANLKRGINNGLKTTKAKALYLVVLSFLVITLMMLFFLISFMSSGV